MAPQIPWQVGRANRDDLESLSLFLVDFLGPRRDMGRP